MLHIIIGGSGSGKSEYAEKIACHICQKKDEAYSMIYIATMYPYGMESNTMDKETEKRIDRHKKLRLGKGFRTIEQYTGAEGILEKIINPDKTVCLLECMSNLLANEMFLEEGRVVGDSEALFKQVEEAIVKPIVFLSKQLGDLIVVTNEVFSDGRSNLYDEKTKDYIRALGYINQRLAGEATRVTEVLAGIPIQVK